MTTASSAVILAGGASKRMGQDKAAAVIAGRSLLDHSISNVVAAGLKPIVIGRSNQHIIAAEPPLSSGDQPVEIWFDDQNLRHPLFGLATALHNIQTPFIVLPVDMPLLPSTLLATLANHKSRCAVTSHNGFLQPLLGLYTPSRQLADRCLLTARAEGSVSSFVKQLQPTVLAEEWLRQFGDPAIFMRGANSPAELKELEQTFQSR